MTVALILNGSTFDYPQVGDTNWGNQATLWASAVTSGMLQKAGGTFTLTAEVNFGATYGLKTAYYKTQTANNASAGAYRLARADVVSWRNQANGANLDLGPSASNILQFNGEDIIAGAIVNADIDAAAAIAFSKMAALTVSRALVSDGSGVVSVSAVTGTELGYVSGVTSAIQTQLTARLPLAGGTMTGDLFLNGSPSADNQAANKLYVDNASAGNVNNFTVRVASTAAINLASELENGDTVDGVVLATGNLVLVKNQASTAANGIYVVPAAGAAARYTGMDIWTEVIGATVFVTAGTVNAGTQWKFNTAAGGTIDVTAIPIVQSNASQVYTASGEGIELAGSQFSLELDGTTLTKAGAGLKVTDLGIANAQIASAAAIAVNKLAALTVSRAVVSDGSGFVSAATTTATEIGYVNGVTSAIQTQLNARIANVLTTTTGDMIYASAANTPARLAVGTAGYYILSTGGIPTWTDRKVSFTQFLSNDASLSVTTTFAALALGAAVLSVGTAVTRTLNTFTFAFTGVHIIDVDLGAVEGGSTRYVAVRLRNTTDSTTLATSTTMGVTSSGIGQHVTLYANVSDIAKVYELQIAASGSAVTVNQQTVNGVSPHLWNLSINRIPQ